MKATNKLYKGKVILNFNSFKHRYTVDGETIPSVTKVLNIIAKPALVSWSARMATEHVMGCIEPGVAYDEVQLSTIFEGAKKAHWQKKKDAGDIGMLMHNWIENYINGENPGMPVNEMLKEGVDNFLAWVKINDVKFLKAEEPIYSRKFKYAGIMDFICTIDGKLYVGDIKTSKGIYPEYLLQTSAYRYAREEEYPKEEYVGQVIVRVGKDGSFETAIVEDTALYQEMVKAFIAAMRLQGTMEKLKKI